MPVLIVHLMFYASLSFFTRAHYSVVINLDNSIPFVKEFVIPYVMWFPVVPSVLMYICIKDKSTYFRLIISLVASLLVCYISFFLYQTTVPRPDISGNDILTQLVLIIYKIDKPVNCFPSIHVLICVLLIEGMWTCKGKKTILSIIVTIICTLIILSTVFIKQHVVLDGVFGIAIAVITFILSNIFVKEKATDGFKKVYSGINSKLGVNS